MSHAGTRDFLLRLGADLSAAGTPAHRVESCLTVCAEQLDEPGQFFSMPTALIATFGSGDDAQTRIARVEPGNTDIDALIALDEVFNHVVDGRLTPKEGAERLDAIESRPAPFHPLAVAAAFGVCGLSACPFFGGGWKEMIGAGVVGTFVGAIALLLADRGPSARLLDFIAGLGAALASAALTTITPLNATTVALASIIVLIPGLTLTVAINELSTRNLASGSARLMGALTVLLSLGLGVAIGTHVGSVAFGDIHGMSTSPTFWWAEPLAFVTLTLALAVLFRVKPAHLPVVLLAVVVGLYCARGGVWLLGSNLGGSIGAFALGAVSNLYARLRDRPSAVVLLPGIIVLVPGVVGLSGVSALIARDDQAGLSAIAEMFIAATGLVTGLLLANVAVPPRKVL